MGGGGWGCFQLSLESDSSSEVISLIHSGRCANILPKISWQRTQAALMLEVFTLCGPGGPTNTRTNTSTHTRRGLLAIDVTAPICGSDLAP